MNRNFPSVLLALLMLSAIGCDKKAKDPATPAPTPAVAQDSHNHVPTGMEEMADRQLEFLALALIEHRDTLESVTCHCCAKSLATCYTETLQQQPGACPPT